MYYKNMNRKQIYLTSLISSGALTAIGYALLLLSGWDKKGYTIIVIHKKMFQMLARFSVNVPHCLALIGVLLLTLAMMVLMIVFNIKRGQKKKIVIALLPLLTGYLFILSLSYFFTGIFGNAFSKLIISYLSFIVSIIAFISSILFFLVDLKFGKNKPLYIIQDSMPGIDELTQVNS